MLTLFGLTSLLIAQTPQTANKAASVQPGEVHFAEIASQTGLTSLNVYGNDTHKEYILESTGNGAIIFDTTTMAGPIFFFPTDQLSRGSRKGKLPPGTCITTIATAHLRMLPSTPVW